MEAALPGLPGYRGSNDIYQDPEGFGAGVAPVSSGPAPGSVSGTALAIRGAAQ